MLSIAVDLKDCGLQTSAGMIDAPMGPKEVRSSVLTQDEEAIAVAFRKDTPLLLDDCLYALRATIPHLTRSSLLPAPRHQPAAGGRG